MSGIGFNNRGSILLALNEKIAEATLDAAGFVEANLAEAQAGTGGKFSDAGTALQLLETLCMPPRMTSAYTSAPKHYTETPTEVFASSTVLADRKYLVIRNESASIRLRCGISSTNLQRDGSPIEPGAVVIIQFNTAVATTIYACSEGRSITCHIAEDTAV